MVVAVADRAPSEPCRAGRWRRGVPREGGKTCLIDEGGGCSVGGVRVVIVVISIFFFFRFFLSYSSSSLPACIPLPPSVYFCIYTFALRLHAPSLKACKLSWLIA